MPTIVHAEAPTSRIDCLVDASADRHYTGVVVGMGTNPFTQAATLFDASAGGLAYLQTDQPFAWAAPDVLSLNLRWRRG